MFLTEGNPRLGRTSTPVHRELMKTVPELALTPSSSQIYALTARAGGEDRIVRRDTPGGDRIEKLMPEHRKHVQAIRAVHERLIESPPGKKFRIALHGLVETMERHVEHFGRNQLEAIASAKVYEDLIADYLEELKDPASMLTIYDEHTKRLRAHMHEAAAFVYGASVDPEHLVPQGNYGFEEIRAVLPITDDAKTDRFFAHFDNKNAYYYEYGKFSQELQRALFQLAVYAGFHLGATKTLNLFRKLDAISNKTDFSTRVTQHAILNTGIGFLPQTVRLDWLEKGLRRLAELEQKPRRLIKATLEIDDGPRKRWQQYVEKNVVERQMLVKTLLPAIDTLPKIASREEAYTTLRPSIDKLMEFVDTVPSAEGVVFLTELMPYLCDRAPVLTAGGRADLANYVEQCLKRLENLLEPQLYSRIATNEENAAHFQNDAAYPPDRKMRLLSSEHHAQRYRELAEIRVQLANL